MTTGGIIFMLLSVGGTTWFLGWCISRVLRESDASSKVHSQVDIQTPDVERED